MARFSYKNCLAVPAAPLQFLPEPAALLPKRFCWGSLVDESTKTLVTESLMIKKSKGHINIALFKHSSSDVTSNFSFD